MYAIVLLVVRSIFLVPVVSVWFLLSDIIAALQKCVTNEVLEYLVSSDFQSLVERRTFEG